MSDYRRVTVSPLVGIVVALDTWTRLTKPQRQALVDPATAHPRTLANLHAKHLMRKDRKPTAWGRRVLTVNEHKWTTPERGEQ